MSLIAMQIGMMMGQQHYVDFDNILQSVLPTNRYTCKWLHQLLKNRDVGCKHHKSVQRKLQRFYDKFIESDEVRDKLLIKEDDGEFVLTTLGVAFMLEVATGGLQGTTKAGSDWLFETKLYIIQAGFREGSGSVMEKNKWRHRELIMHLKDGM